MSKTRLEFKQRIELLKLYQKRVPVYLVAKRFNLSRAAIYYQYKKFEEEGFEQIDLNQMVDDILEG